MSARDELSRPFLAIATTPTMPTRALGAALPALETPPVTSPWLPRPAQAAAAPAAAPAPAGPSPAEIAKVMDDARATGRAEGLAETEALRKTLAAFATDLAQARAAIAPPAADAIAAIAICVIDAWLGATPRAEQLAPLVRGYLARSTDQPATARIHPDDAEALADAIGEAPLEITTDPALAPGALEIRGATLELVHDWQARLAELRTAITAALTGSGGEP